MPLSSRWEGRESRTCVVCGGVKITHYKLEMNLLYCVKTLLCIHRTKEGVTATGERGGPKAGLVQ